MTLARKLGIRIAVLVAALVVVGTASVWGLLGLRRHFRVAEDEYEQLRSIYEVGNHAAAARMLLNATPPDVEAARVALDRATRALQDPRVREAVGADAEYEALARQLAAVSLTADTADLPSGLSGLSGVNQALGRIASVAERIKRQIIANREAASDRLILTLIVMSAVTLVALVAAVWQGRAQYRSIVSPLTELEDRARKIAAANFEGRLPVDGEAEFARVAEQFNRMASELERLYRDLEREVQQKSSQLVRSEKLAGIGYLAAGVAHEINNPLGIIAVHAEGTLKRLGDTGIPADVAGRFEKSLRVIGEEAFRCKGIIDRLLALAGPGAGDEGKRDAVSLAKIVRRVESLLSVLPQFRDRRLEVQVESGEHVRVTANEAEITQVVLNLVCNALEAVAPGDVSGRMIGDASGAGSTGTSGQTTGGSSAGGRVKVRVLSRGGWGCVEVHDNGRGMTPQTLDRVFEPFFTDKPRRGERGTGLGLSVSHAIVDQHGGRLRADSKGSGRGSSFVMELPLAPVSEVAHG